MCNENSKNDLLKEIVNLSNTGFDNIDIMFVTSKFWKYTEIFSTNKKSK